MMQQYVDFVRDTYENGVTAHNPRGGYTIRRIGGQLKFDLKDGFPLVGSRLTRFGSVVSELLWFLAGSTNVNTLQSLGSNIWNQWADEAGDIGPLYGEQWTRMIGSFDLSGLNQQVYQSQLQYVIECIKNKPNSRRIILNAWNPDKLPMSETALYVDGKPVDPEVGIQANIANGRMAIAPCHNQVQFFVTERSNGTRELSAHLYQRSSDTVIGLPYNIAEYALLVHILAAHCGYEVGELFISFGDRHVYGIHVDEGLEELLDRDVPPMPTLDLYDLDFTRLLNMHASYRNCDNDVPFEQSKNYHDDVVYLIDLKQQIIDRLAGYTHLGAMSFTVVT